MTRAQATASLPRPDWLPLGEWPFALKAIRVEEHVVHYVDEGRGPTLLFVHAGFWSFVWRDVIQLLSRRFRCVALDFPNHGLSEAAVGYEASLERHAATLEAFVRELQLDDATWILHDLGGPIGLHVASRRPGTVNGILASQTFAWPPHVSRMRMALRLFGSRPVELVDRALNLIPRVSSGRMGVGRHLTPAGRAAFLGPFRRKGPIRAFHRLIADASRADRFLANVQAALRTELSNQRLATIYGERNDPFGYQDRFRAMFPGVHEHVVAGGGHFPMCDDPEAFAAQVKWLVDEKN